MSLCLYATHLYAVRFRPIGKWKHFESETVLLASCRSIAACSLFSGAIFSSQTTETGWRRRTGSGIPRRASSRSDTSPFLRRSAASEIHRRAAPASSAGGILPRLPPSASRNRCPPERRRETRKDETRRRRRRMRESLSRLDRATRTHPPVGRVAPLFDPVAEPENRVKLTG